MYQSKNSIELTRLSKQSSETGHDCYPVLQMRHRNIDLSGQGHKATKLLARSKAPEAPQCGFTLLPMPVPCLLKQFLLTL